ncbi:MAG: peptidylprolyl isomerase [Bacteroidota bacterium]
MLPRRSLWLGLVCAGLFAACGTPRPTTAPVVATVPPPPPVAAEFAGETLSLEEFEAQYARSVGSAEVAAADTLGAYEDFLERYVNFRLKVQAARDLGLDTDSSYTAELDNYREQLARPYLLEQEVTEEVIQTLFDRQQEEVRASHILLRATPEASPADTLAAFARLSALRDSILAGADFGALAQAESEDPSAATNQGDLGYFSAGRMIEAFEVQAYTVPVDSVSEVFRTRFGYHVLKVTDRRAARGDISARHILIRFSGQTAADSAAALQTITELQGRIAGGEDFATLARQYSEDPGSAENGGDLGFFGTGRMVPAFEQAAFALASPGDVSDIVETRFGYHLIQLIEVKPPPSYDEAYPELKRLAERLPRTARRREALAQTYQEKVGFTFDSTLVANAVADFPADSVVTRADQDGFGTFTDSTFATIGDAGFTLGQFKEQLRASRPTGPTLDALVEAMTRYLAEETITIAARDLEDTDEDFARIMQEYADGILLFAISEDSVWTVAQTDTTGLEAYFQDRQASYQFPERRRVVAYSSRVDSVLTRVAEFIDGGVSPLGIQERLAADSLSVRVDTVFVSEPSDTAYDRAFDLDIGDRTEPLANRSTRTILVLDGIEAPRGKTLEEARAEVLTDYQDHLEEAWVARLRERYDARTYPDVLADAFAEEKAALPETATE